MIYKDLIKDNGENSRLNISLQESTNNQKDDDIDISDDFNFTNENIDFHLSIITSDERTYDQLIKSLTFIENKSHLPEVSDYLFNCDIHEILFNIIAKEQRYSDPNSIIIFLNITNNILLLPDKLTAILMSPFQQIFYDIINQYSIGPPIVVSTIFDTFLTLIKPPADISLFTDYLSFFNLYLQVFNPCQDPNITVKAFKCCNKMFDIAHPDLQSKMLDNDFVDPCYIHMNRKTPSFFEACQLIGNIGYLNRYILEHLPDDFFKQLIVDLLQDDNDDIVAAVISLCESLSSIETISDLLINEKKIFKRILKTSERNFQVKKCSIDLITTLMESQSIYLERNLEEYGTLDFLTAFLETEDYEISSKVLSAMTFLIRNFIENKHYFGVKPPFISVLQNSMSLYDFLSNLRFREDLQPDIQEASTLVFNLFSESLDRYAKQK